MSLSTYISCETVFANCSFSAVIFMYEHVYKPWRDNGICGSGSFLNAFFFEDISDNIKW